ncbi:MAG TPA: carboxypeptidase-like regulatory domain-containing protein [Vicinamibacterales bacterium]|nr:carboxypeptidase-like regulatory domain-containing protein [Vicinamibacterales bacterium]
MKRCMRLDLVGRWSDLSSSVALVLSTSVCVAAQVPVAGIGGSVTDASGAVVVDAAITIRRTDTGLLRTATTDARGTYIVENVPPATYQIEALHPGFARAVREVTLRVGEHATVNLELTVEELQERVDVRTQPTSISRNNVEVGGTVGRLQIEQLPLNGRSFLQLAQLQPGVDVVSTTNPGEIGNNYQRLVVSGAYYSQTRITVDGSTTGDRFVGGTTQNFSQESVQEFQVATFSLDTATGLTGAGAVNIVTRSGSNQLRGSAFTYYRDHHLAAYPGLSRDPANPDPAFARRQTGGSAGGPLKRDRLFWFTNYEHNDQDAVFNVTNNHPIFSKFDGVFPNPLKGDLFNARLDSRVHETHQAFLRFSLDDNRTTAPAVVQVGLPSNWQSIHNRAYQMQGGITSTLSRHLVNDVRIAFNTLVGQIDPVSPSECVDPVPCTGVGGPNLLVFDAPRFSIGNQSNSPFGRRQGTVQIVDNVTWQGGLHRLRIGGEWEHSDWNASIDFNEPARITLWGPSNLQTPALRPLYDTLPVSLRDPHAPPPTLQEILQLPLQSFTIGIGDPSLPGPYNHDDASRNDRVRAYFQDTWDVSRKLTLMYGVAYSFETNLFAHDLDYPAYLSPIIGSDLRPPRRDANNFDPSAHVAWSVGSSGRTVVRAGAGVYHDEASFFWKARDRAFIGPAGNGRVNVDGSVVGLSFTSTPTAFRGQDLFAAPARIAVDARRATRHWDGSLGSGRRDRQTGRPDRGPACHDRL